MHNTIYYGTCVSVTSIGTRIHSSCTSAAAVSDRYRRRILLHTAIPVSATSCIAVALLEWAVCWTDVLALAVPIWVPPSSSHFNKIHEDCRTLLRCSKTIKLIANSGNRLNRPALHLVQQSLWIFFIGDGSTQKVCSAIVSIYLS